MEEPYVAPSARKHGVADDDMLHAIRNPVRIFELDEGMTMWIGPGYNGQILEVGVIDSSDEQQVVVHALPATREVPQLQAVMQMPRTIDEILAHADGLARAFEDYEPSVSDERSPDPVPMLRAAAQGRADAERIVVEAVRYARKDGLSWATIGTALGTTGEAARQRYGREHEA